MGLRTDRCQMLCMHQGRSPRKAHVGHAPRSSWVQLTHEERGALNNSREMSALACICSTWIVLFRNGEDGQLDQDMLGTYTDAALPKQCKGK